MAHPMTGTRQMVPPDEQGPKCYIIRQVHGITCPRTTHITVHHTSIFLELIKQRILEQKAATKHITAKNTSEGATRSVLHHQAFSWLKTSRRSQIFFLGFWKVGIKSNKSAAAHPMPKSHPIDMGQARHSAQHRLAFCRYEKCLRTTKQTFWRCMG